MADWCGRGGDLQWSWERFLWHRSWLQFRSDLVVSWIQFHFKKNEDHATIGPRSRVDRGIDAPTTAIRWSWRWFHDERCSIAPRSRFDQTAIVEFFHESSGLSDGDPVKSDGPDRTITLGLMRDRGPCDEDHRDVRVMDIRTIVVVRTIRCRPRDGNQTHQKAPHVSTVSHRSGFIPAVRWWLRSLPFDENQCFSWRHVAIGEPLDLQPLTLSFGHVRWWLIVWTRSTRSTVCGWIQRLCGRLVTCTLESCGNIVPHGRKNKEK